VSPDGHNWSTAAYATDYLEKTVPSNYSARGRSYDYEGTNRGFTVGNIPDDDVGEPANGYIWDALAKARVSMRNYGEFVVRAESTGGAAPNEDQAGRARRAGRYVGTKAALRSVTNGAYPGFDLDIRDQVRADIWLRDFAEDVRTGDMPTLEIVKLPNDHTAGARTGSPTPAAYMADNDLALGRMVEAVSRSPYWRNTVFFVLRTTRRTDPIMSTRTGRRTTAAAPCTGGRTPRTWWRRSSTSSEPRTSRSSTPMVVPCATSGRAPPISLHSPCTCRRWTRWR
jgi:hypothetical protein